MKFKKGDLVKTNEKAPFKPIGVVEVAGYKRNEQGIVKIKRIGKKNKRVYYQYVHQDFLDLVKRVGEEKTEKGKEPKLDIKGKVIETDECIVTGIGTVKISGYKILTRLNLEYLKKAVRVIEELHRGEKNIKIDLAIAPKHPLIIGRYNEATNAISGVVIAPIIGQN